MPTTEDRKRLYEKARDRGDQAAITLASFDYIRALEADNQYLANAVATLQMAGHGS